MASVGQDEKKEQLLMRPLIYSAAFLAVLADAGHAQVGNRENGLALAQQVCSECHAIRAGQARSPNSRSPTFSELATTPGMTPIALMVALTTPHAGMPMFMLTAEQREDIIAYILGLR
jgi:mono/diheme cytochrome c family protein